nr:Putative lipoprotein NMB1124/NMB1162 precursor [Providencia rettgeri]
MKHLLIVCGLVMTWLLTGCAQPTKVDYTAFNQSKPKSILVLLPQNSSPEVQASHGLLSQATLPLAEAGYYVFSLLLLLRKHLSKMG